MMSSGVKFKAKSAEEEKREGIRETQTMSTRKAEKEESERGRGKLAQKIGEENCLGFHRGSNEWAMREE